MVIRPSVRAPVVPPPETESCHPECVEAGEQPGSVFSIFALLFHKTEQRTPLVDCQSSVLDLAVQDIEALAGGRHSRGYTTKVPVRFRSKPDTVSV
jgi:hypothetical protein